MADDSCPVCGKLFLGMEEHGRQTHIGRCIAKQDRTRDAGAPFLPMPQQDAGEEQEGVADVDTQASPERNLDPRVAHRNPELAEEIRGLTSGDRALLRLFYERSDLKVSLIDAILDIAREREPPTFLSAAHFIALVDRLPGPTFMRSVLRLEGVGVDFPLFHRDLCEIATTLLDRFDGFLLDPDAPRPMAEGMHDFVDGARYKQLLSALRTAAGPDAFLVPLVINSGGVLVFTCLRTYFSDEVVDSTNLAKFNLTSPGAKAHPIYVTFGIFETPLFFNALTLCREHSCTFAVVQ